MKSFLGYLEGTEKSEHTIRNYRFDLQAFERFLREGNRTREVLRVQSITFKQIEAFHAELRRQGLKTNTRRRKILTIRRFLGYLSRRKKVSETMDRKLPAPQKIERIPFTVMTGALVERIRTLPAETALDARNRVLLWTLAETGCLVSEVRLLRFESFAKIGPSEFRVRIDDRSVPVSQSLHDAVLELRNWVKAEPGAEGQDFLFRGFNKFGPLSQSITPRGIELLVRAYAPKLAPTAGSEGAPDLAGRKSDLVPRTFRHSVVLHWFSEGVSRDEIQKRLGLKTAYAFRLYEPLLRSNTGAAS